MQHRQNSDLSSPLSAHNPRNESNSFLPRVPVNWETHLNWMHSSVKHLHTQNPFVPHGQLCQALPAWGSAKEGMGWRWWANTVKAWCSWQNEGSGAELALAKLSPLDHLASQLQRICKSCSSALKHELSTLDHSHRHITGLESGVSQAEGKRKQKELLISLPSHLASLAPSQFTF